MKNIVSLVFAIALCLFLCACGNDGPDTQYPPITTTPIQGDINESTSSLQKTAFLPLSNSESVGKKQEDVVKLLNQAGFNNVSVVPRAELEASEIERKGEICKIVVDNSETFNKGDEFDKTVAIEITFLDFKKVTVPVAANDVGGLDADNLVNLFKSAGFFNVSIEIVKDIDPEYSEEKFRNEISINYDESFDTEDTFPVDAKVIITSHRPMEKYKVKIKIDFLSNLFFSRYGVDIELGYNELGTLSHGEDDSFELWLEPGKHTIRFRKTGYKKPEKEVTFTIRGEAEVTYQISCYEDSIHVEQNEFVDKGAVGEGEAMMPASAQDFKYDNYKDVETALKNAGFTNIKTAILYDIVWGWTSEGEVDSVSVNGSKDFAKGDVFKQDAEIIITYHMWADDDPSLIKMPKAASEYEGLQYSEVEKAFKDLGFGNVVLEEKETTSKDYKTGEVFNVTIDGDQFSAGESYKPTDKVLIKYYTRKITLEELQTMIRLCQGKPAEEVLALFDGTEYSIRYSIEGVATDSLDPKGLFFKDGTIDTDAKTITLDFTEKDPAAVEKALEAFLPKEMALRAAVVAMTNGSATDVFKKDGSTYDTSKFHKYSDLSGFYLSVYEAGTWVAKDKKTWHVTGFICRISGYTTFLHASMDVTYKDKKYVVSNVDKLIAPSATISDEDWNKHSYEHLEPSKSNPFLTVSASLVKADRDSIAEIKQNNKTMPTEERQEWIEDQFSWWDGEHTQLKKLIKKNLNDESSYKHIETWYRDVINKDLAAEINKVLKESGYDERIKVGDLLVVCEFSAKNVFGTKVKNTAIAISRFDSNTIELIGFE